MEIREHVALGPYTTLGVGGPARFFAETATEPDVRQAVEWATERQLSLFILGGGSNLVISDSGWPGIVLKMSILGRNPLGPDNGREAVEYGAGEEWDRVVEQSVAANCSGMECLSGIPGTVGGTPVQNVGAYGQDVSETIVRVRAFDLQSGATVEFSNAECEFAYRSSRFNSRNRGRYVILAVTFATHPGGAPRLEYADIKRYFETQPKPPTLANVREAVREIRHGKAMLLVEGDADARSAGSFFKNPVIAAEHYQRIFAIAESRHLTLPKYPVGEGRVKVPAAWLVEQAGFHKGFTFGTVGISSRHTLALVNRGGATATDVLALKDLVQKRVFDTFGVELQPEPVFVGFDLP